MSLRLVLATLLDTLAGPSDLAYRGRVPARARYAHPDPAASIGRIERKGGIVYTDIFRGASGQLAAKRRRPATTKAVGLSGHGFGFCIDCDVNATLKRRAWTYDRMLDELAAEGWHCHRRDRKRGPEDWHFNFLGTAHADLLALAKVNDRSTWDDPIEALIQRIYGPQLAPSDAEVSRLLALLRLDARGFQRAWDLTVDGVVGPRTRRVLAYVTAELDVRSFII